MTFKIAYTDVFLKSFDKLDRSTQERIYNWIENNLTSCKDPRLTGKSLQYKLKGLWRYRIGDYRIICEIQDKQMIILLLDVGHRRKIYD